MKNIEVENQGREHAEFSAKLRMEAQTATQLLKPHGVSLLDVVKIALPIIQSRKKSQPVGVAVEKFL